MEPRTAEQVIVSLLFQKYRLSKNLQAQVNVGTTKNGMPKFNFHSSIFTIITNLNDITDKSRNFAAIGCAVVADTMPGTIGTSVPAMINANVIPQAEK
jgi:hypothetical protein